MNTETKDEHLRVFFLLFSVMLNAEYVHIPEYNASCVKIPEVQLLFYYFRTSIGLISTAGGHSSSGARSISSMPVK